VYPKPLSALVAALGRLPGVGPKSAERLALHLLRLPAAEVRALAQAMLRVKEEVRACGLCGNLAESDPCPICADPERDPAQIMVVETPADLAALESARSFRGRYHVLAGALAPLEGVGPRELRLAELVARVRAGGVTEVIVATNPTVEGEATADLVAKSLAACAVNLTRLGCGVPVGADLKYMDPITLGRSLAGRRRLEN